MRASVPDSGDEPWHGGSHRTATTASPPGQATADPCAHTGCWSSEPRRAPSRTEEWHRGKSSGTAGSWLPDARTTPRRAPGAARMERNHAGDHHEPKLQSPPAPGPAVAPQPGPDAEPDRARQDRLRGQRSGSPPPRAARSRSLDGGRQPRDTATRRWPRDRSGPNRSDR